MVGLFKALLPLLLATFAAAQDQTFNFILPNKDVWWVADSANVMKWNCTDPVARNDKVWTVFLNNTSPSVFTGPLGIIAQQSNDDCSRAVTHDQANLPVGTGYYIIFANDLNASDVYATSDLFEVKALGSPYPSTSSDLAASGTATASSSASASSKNGAALGTHSPSFPVLTGIMGLLTVGLLGA